MHIFVRSAVALAVLAIAAPASAAVDRNVSITAAHPTEQWTSETGSGLNPSNYTDEVPRKETAYACTKDPNTYCDNALVHVVLNDIGGGNVRVRMDGFQPTSDYDLRVYDADAEGVPQTEQRTPEGDRGTAQDAPYPTEVPGSPVPVPEQVPVNPPSQIPWADPMTFLETANGDYETTNVDLTEFVDQDGNLDAYFLIEVPYWAVVNDHYTMTVSLTETTPFVPAEEIVE